MRRALAVIGVALVSASCSSSSSSYTDADRSELTKMCVDSGIAPASGLQLDESCEQLAKTLIDQADQADCVKRMDLLRSTMSGFLGSMQAGDPVGAEDTMHDRITKCAVGP